MRFPELLLRHGGVIGLGFALTFLSSFGQTFFISLSVPDIRDAFGLTNGGFSLIYSIATLSSGLLMIWAGSAIDRVGIGLYVTIALIGLSAAALGLSFAPNIVALGLSLFFLRLFGQGMLGHAGVTNTARLPLSVRGRAVDIATLGYSTGEASLPGIALVLIATLGWSNLWRTAAGLILACLILGWALTFVLERKNRDRAGPVHGDGQQGTGLRLIDVLKDRRFLALVPALIGYPAIVTAYFLHQRLMSEAQGWPLELLATGITIYALVGVVVTMTAGTLVDRFGAVRLSHFYLLGLIAASLALAAFRGPVLAPFFFGLIGLSSGATNVVVAAVLAELFGTQNLGKIRALAASLMVVSSALGPGIAGILLDAGVSFETIGLWSAGYLVAASGFTFALPNPRA
jgi:MFS family permease